MTNIKDSQTVEDKFVVIVRSAEGKIKKIVTSEDEHE